jgi:hypothetical protein
VPGFSHLVLLGGGHLLFGYGQATGEIGWGRVDSGCVILGGRGAWIRGWSQLMPFAFDGEPHLLVYETQGGKAEIHRVESERLIRIHAATWSLGWTAFVPFIAYGQPHYLLYKAGIGQVHIDWLSRDRGPSTFWAFQRPPGYPRVVPFQLKNRPHYIAYNPGNGDFFVDRIDP